MSRGSVKTQQKERGYVGVSARPGTYSRRNRTDLPTANPKGTMLMRLRDVLGDVDHDEHVTCLSPVKGQPADMPWRVALVTVVQDVEHLIDRQAANAVRERIDGTSVPGLELSDPRAVTFLAFCFSVPAG